MSTIEKQGPLSWSNITNETLDPKYEKCRNIAEEIYKRINITFQIKKLEASTQSDVSDLSDQIDSNELSNETDLFACDKSSLSSTDVEQSERGAAACEKYININNNEEQLKKSPAVCKRPRKRFRKRIKKTQKNQQRDSDGSSDEGPPLSLVAESGRPPRVPKLVLLAADLSKLKTPSPERKPTKRPDVQIDAKLKTDTLGDSKMKSESKKPIHVSDNMLPTIPIVPIDFSQKSQQSERVEKIVGEKEVKSSKCGMCNLPFRSERGLRRHIAVAHQSDCGSDKKRTEQRGKPA